MEAESCSCPGAHSSTYNAYRWDNIPNKGFHIMCIIIWCFIIECDDNQSIYRREQQCSRDSLRSSHLAYQQLCHSNRLSSPCLNVVYQLFVNHPATLVQLIVKGVKRNIYFRLIREKSFIESYIAKLSTIIFNRCCELMTQCLWKLCPYELFCKNIKWLLNHNVTSIVAQFVSHVQCVCRVGRMNLWECWPEREAAA